MELKLYEVSVVWNSTPIERLQQEAKERVLRNTQGGEIAIPIFTMMSKRDEQLASIILIKNRLAGISRDVIVNPPHTHLSTMLNRPRKIAIAILSGVAWVLLQLVLVLLGRSIMPGLAAPEELASFSGQNSPMRPL